MTRWLGKVVLAVIVGISPAEASTITVSNTFEWGVAPATFQTFADNALPQWTQTVTFSPQADSIISATLTLRHAGNKANNHNGSNGEFWLLSSQGSTFIGNLSASWSPAAGDFFVTDTFVLPSVLFPSLPAGAWSLALKLTETTNQTDSLSLDFSTLGVTYQTAPTPTPEPATLSLLCAGLATAAWRRRRQRRSGA